MTRSRWSSLGLILALGCASPVGGGLPSQPPPSDGKFDTGGDQLSTEEGGMEGEDAGPSATGDRPPLPPAASPCGPFPDYYVPYLDDTACTARTPADRDREFTCPVVASSDEGFTLDGRTVRYLPVDAPVEVDETALADLVPADDVRMTVVLVRRVDGRPVYRYLSNGRHDEVVQPWSTTKFLAVANAAAQLRITSGYTVGLGAEVQGIPLGDLVTVIHAYEESQFSSNGLSRWFHDVGGRANANALIHGWLDRPSTETFGGNYGATAPDLGYTLTQGEATLTLEPDATTGIANQLSTFTLAESLKRLVMHREDAATRLPGIQWADVQTILYGAEDSQWYGPGDRQGMESDTAVYMLQGHELEDLWHDSHGRYRVFGKLGAGYARGGELAHVGYGCFPVLDDAGAPILDEGQELFIATHLSANGAFRHGDTLMAEYYRRVIQAVRDGVLQ